MFNFAIKMFLLILTSVLILSAILNGSAYYISTSIFIYLPLYALVFILCAGIYVMYIALIVSIIKNLVKGLNNIYGAER